MVNENFKCVEFDRRNGARLEVLRRDDGYVMDLVVAGRSMRMVGLTDGDILDCALMFASWPSVRDAVRNVTILVDVADRG